jgi:superoxide dismutase, Cu-Zn family
MGQPKPPKQRAWGVAALDMNGVSGSVVVLDGGVGVRLRGLSPGPHGFHVHQCGDLRGEQCSACGPHFDPLARSHGGRVSPPERHPGDFGNVTADASGRVDEWIDVPGLRLADVVGRSVVVHAGEDDLGRGLGQARQESLKTGNSGARLACGVIGWGC